MDTWLDTLNDERAETWLRDIICHRFPDPRFDLVFLLRLLFSINDCSLQARSVVRNLRGLLRAQDSIPCSINFS